MDERLGDPGGESAAFSGRELADKLTPALTQNEIQEVSPEDAEKTAQLKRAEHFYFGKKRLAQILEFVADPSTPDTDLRAGILGTIRQEFTIEDETEIAELSTQLNGISSLHDNSALAATVSGFLTIRGRVEDYETVLRRRFTESQGFTPLNATYSFHTADRAAFLHIAPSRTLTQTERSQQLLSGLTSLADQLAHNPDLTDVQDVKMVSLLVSSYRPAIEQLGFEVKEVEDEAILSAFSTPKGSLLEAGMSKTAFVQRYSEASQSPTY